MKGKELYSTEALILMIQKGGKDRQQAISFLFEHNKGRTLGTLQTLGASLALAEDLLQEGMLILIRQVQANKFQGKNQASLHTYFVGICKNLLRAEFRRKQAEIPLSPSIEPPNEKTFWEQIESEETQFRLHRCLKLLGETCRQILLLRAQAPPIPWAELAQDFSYKDAQNAMNKGGKCLKKLRTLFFQS